MIEDDEAGWNVALQLRDHVLAAHPMVAVDILEAENGSFTQLVFTPPNPRGASVWVYVRADCSLEVNAGSMVIDGLEYSSDLAENIRLCVKLVLSLAENGYSKVRSLWLLGALSPHFAGPTAGFWGLDEYIDRPWSRVVESLDPWENTKAADSD